MAFIKRLRLLTALLGAGAATAVVGSAVFGDQRATRPATGPASRPVATADPAARTRFSDRPALAYRKPDGQTVFAWQVKPQLAAAARPRDLLVMIDTSASQAGDPLAQARGVLAGLAAAAGPNDRLDVWTVNHNNPAVTRSLTGGFQPAKSAAVTAATEQLAQKEYGSGAVDLKPALEAAGRQFPAGDRLKAVVYLGDGESAASPTPFTEAVRVQTGHQLADREVGFFAVPLGATVHPHNLHGLAATTGGTVVRPTADTAAAVLAAVDVPVLRADKWTFGPAGVEVFPSRLPPLRADRSTLVVGTLKAPAEAVSVRVEGRVNGRAETVELAERLPAAEPANYFLDAMCGQWKAAPASDAPAILPADRTLAAAAEQFRLYRDEFAGQGTAALTAERLDHAEKLFQASLRLDPQGPDAAAGLRVIDKLRTGKTTTQQVKALVNAGTTLARVAQDPPAPPPAGVQPPPAAQPVPPPPGATPAEQNLFDQARAAQQIAEQQFRLLVNDTLSRARRLVTSDPDGAYEDLKRQRDGVLANDELGDATRRRLVQDLEAAMREVQLKGAQVKRDIASQRERVAQARQRLAEFDRQQTLEEQTRARVDSFKQLMQQARFELAQQEAQVMIQERVSRGLGIPPETYAAYRIGQSAGNLREQRELRRVREDRYLLTMLQVDKSFIPYPDEPPVHFPPAAVWRELTANRERNYGPGSLGPTAPESFRRVRSLLEGESDRRVNVGDLGAKTLGTLLDELTQQFQEYGLRFVFRTELFPEGTQLRDQKLKTPSNLSGLPLGSFLDTVLRDVGMTFIARPEYIEIGPNTQAYSLRYDEKVTKVFDVAELIIGIPNAQNTSQLLQNLQFLGQQATIFGAALNPFNGLNPFGFAGGGGVGGFGGGQFGGGGVGGFGGGLGGGGALGGVGGAAGGPLGGGGALGAGGFQGGGFQGGGVGLQGGGVAGNPTGGLGGQFGIQGNDQSQFLLSLIFSTVAYKEWVPPAGVLQGQAAADYQPKVPPEQLNTLGLYPPSRSLVVRASHRYHATPTFDLRRDQGAGMGAGGPGLPGRGGFAAAPGAGGKATADILKEVGGLIAGKEPAKVWNQAFAGQLTKPEAVVQAAETLFDLKEYAHAAEALKAGLRHGRATGGWVQDALAVALKSAQAAPAEVERASLSGVDLEPNDPRAFLRAAEAEGELGRPEVALAFCQRAAALEPNLPASYVDALKYADRGGEVASDATAWATANLLSRDWPADGRDLHGLAKAAATASARKLSAAGKPDAAAKLSGLLGGGGKRDLVIELLWQGKSDLDLVVEEPAGSVCSAVHKRTVGGGALRADVLDQQDDNRAEVYTAVSAFSGTYTVKVKVALDRSLGGQTARLKVTRQQGTPQETVELIGVDLSHPTPVAVKLDGGSRSDLATVPMDPTPARLASTQAPQGADPSRPAAAASQPTVETKVPGIAAGLPGLRVEQKLSADRKRVEVKATPVFAGPAADIPTPTVALLPGGN